MKFSLRLGNISSPVLKIGLDVTFHQTARILGLSTIRRYLLASHLQSFHIFLHIPVPKTVNYNL